MDVRPTWTDCDKARDYVVPNVFSPRDLVSRPDNMDETVPHTLRRHQADSVVRLIPAYWFLNQVQYVLVIHLDRVSDFNI